MSKKIWFDDLSLESINRFNQNTLVSHLGIVVSSFDENSLSATMPVDERTFQPFKMLHGGASCVLAESLGSIAANLCLDPKEYMAVGQHIEATHFRPVQNGVVEGIARAIFIGKSSQTWKIEIFNEQKKIICDSKIIMAVIKKMH